MDEIDEWGVDIPDGTYVIHYDRTKNRYVLMNQQNRQIYYADDGLFYQ
jgi:hypothetical protein